MLSLFSLSLSTTSYAYINDGFGIIKRIWPSLTSSSHGFSSRENDDQSRQVICNNHCKLSCPLQGLVCFVNSIRVCHEVSCHGWPRGIFWRLLVKHRILTYSQRGTVNDQTIWLSYEVCTGEAHGSFNIIVHAWILNLPLQLRKESSLYFLSICSYSVFYYYIIAYLFFIILS